MNHPIPAAPKPAHVPDSLIYDFDYYMDPAHLANPHDRILDLHRKAPPIFWTPRHAGHWMLLSHSANFHAMRAWDSFTSEFIPYDQVLVMMANRPPGTPHVPLAIPITLDPPYHGKYRAPLQSAFSPKAALALKNNIRRLANELIDKVEHRGRCEFMSEIAEPLPIQIFLKLMGLPVERQAEYRRLVKAKLAALNEGRETYTRIQLEIADAMRDTIADRRSNPREDVISMLWQSKVEGKQLTIEDMENYCVLLFIAGLDTVMNGMGNGIRYLAMNSDLQQKLRENPALIDTAKEELLRRLTFTVPVRMVAKDTVFQNVQMKKGDRVMTFLPGADLDGKEFPEPEAFILERRNAHIAFGAGPAPLPRFASGKGRTSGPIRADAVASAGIPA
jgi:cytochrome P450